MTCLRMTIASLMMCVAASAATAQNADEQKQWLGTVGGAKCDMWIHERVNPKSQLAPLFNQWVLGFISGAAMIGTDPSFALTPFTERDVLSRVDVVCSENPSALVVGAASRVCADLMTEIARLIEQQEINKQKEQGRGIR